MQNTTRFSALFLLVTQLFLSPIVHAEDLSISPALKIKAASLQVASLLASERERKNGKLWYREASAIEILLYRSPLIAAAAAKNENFDFEFNGRRKIHFEASTHVLSYVAPRISISLEITNDSLESALVRKNILGITTKDEKGTLSLDGINEGGLNELAQSLYDKTQMSRGFEKGVFVDPYAALNQSQVANPVAEGKQILEKGYIDVIANSTRLDVKEKWAKDGDFEHSKWEYTPIKLISWPLQKIFYDIPAMATGLATESVTRSPLHNLLGAWDELRGAGKLSRNAVKDMGRGIIHPKNGTFVDGTLELLDASLKVANSVLNVAKSGISVVAYPIYRALGGKKSQRVALRGKRAVILLVDTGTGSTIGDGIGDTFGEEIVRSKLKSISDYFCIQSNPDHNNMVECITNIPDNIQYLDIVSLQHSGGVDDAETYMKLAVTLKKVKPELLLSIGCYDDPSKFVDAENSLGQTKTSWAVHYYLANMLEKRLRGLPATDASREAFGEGFLLNAIDPVSWAGVLAIGIGMEDKVRDGYMGSQPNVITPDFVVRNTINDANDQWDSYKTDKARLAQLREFQQKVDALLIDGKIKLKKRILRLLRDSEAKVAVLFPTSG